MYLEKQRTDVSKTENILKQSTSFTLTLFLSIHKENKFNLSLEGER